MHVFVMTGTEMKIMQKIKRDLNGSFTVEAALLMTVLIPLLTALIYLGFYQHDKVWIANKTRTEAMEAALDTDRKNQTDWSGVLACGNVSGGVKRGKNKVTATGKATFRIPGFVARFFMGGQMEINSKAEVSVKNAKKQERYHHGTLLHEGYFIIIEMPSITSPIALIARPVRLLSIFFSLDVASVTA